MEPAVEAKILRCNTDELMDTAIRLNKQYDASIIGTNSKETEIDSEWEGGEELAAGICRGSVAYVAVVDGTAVGLVCGGVDEGGIYYGYLLHLHVLSEYQHRGIGTALLERMERYFEQKECRRIKIAVSPYEEEALSFLEKRGYYQSYIAMKKRIKHGKDG